jgi:hypothetical protein
MISMAVMDMAKEMLPTIVSSQLNLQVTNATEWIDLTMHVAGMGYSFSKGSFNLNGAIAQLKQNIGKDKININVETLFLCLDKMNIDSSSSIFIAAFYTAYAMLLTGGDVEYKAIVPYVGEMRLYWHDMIMNGVEKGFKSKFDMEAEQDRPDFAASPSFIESRIELISTLVDNPKKAINELNLETPQIMLDCILGMRPSLRQHWLNYYPNGIVCPPGVSTEVLEQEVKNLQTWLDAQSET